MSETIRLVVAIPTTGMNLCEFTHSFGLLMAYLTRPIKTRPEAGHEVVLDLQKSSCIHWNREELVYRAIENKMTHLLFLDHDMTFEPNILDIMFGRRQPVVACNYLIKSENAEFVAVSENGRRIITDKESTGLQEIAYTGFGVSLFETHVFQKTPQPWFMPEFVPPARYTTEDNPCFRKIREAGFKCYVDHDASKLVGHADTSRIWRWSDFKKKEQVKNGSHD